MLITCIKCGRSQISQKASISLLQNNSHIFKNGKFLTLLNQYFQSTRQCISSFHVERTMVRLTGAIQAVSGSCEIKRPAQQLETT